jgi:hypothetical protein
MKALKLETVGSLGRSNNSFWAWTFPHALCVSFARVAATPENFMKTFYRDTQITLLCDSREDVGLIVPASVLYAVYFAYAEDTDFWPIRHYNLDQLKQQRPEIIKDLMAQSCISILHQGTPVLALLPRRHMDRLKIDKEGCLDHASIMLQRIDRGLKARAEGVFTLNGVSNKHSLQRPFKPKPMSPADQGLTDQIMQHLAEQNPQTVADVQRALAQLKLSPALQPINNPAHEVG